MITSAIVIGINKVGNMTPLSAAVSGAQQFADWARSQDYTVFPHYDTEKPVTYADVRACVKSIVDSRKCQRLVLFFSGHGKWQGPATEKWLLSHAAEEPAEAINVIPSAFLSVGSGIEHVVFISDACRSAVKDPQINNVSGNAVFAGGFSDIETKFDLIFSSKAGDPSYELRSPEEGEAAFGIFTACLLRALKGNVPQLFKPVELPGSRELFVLESAVLYDFLKVAVPAEAYRRNHNLVQVPDSVITSRLPKFLSAMLEGLDDFTYDDSRPVARGWFEKGTREDLLKSISIWLKQGHSLLPSPRKNILQLVIKGVSNTATFLARSIPATFRIFRPIISSIKSAVTFYDPKEHFEYSMSGIVFHIDDLTPFSISEESWLEPNLGNIQIEGAYTVERASKKDIFITKYVMDFTNFVYTLANGNTIVVPMVPDCVTKVWLKEGQIYHMSINQAPQLSSDGTESKIKPYNNHISKADLFILSVVHSGSSELFRDPNILKRFKAHINKSIVRNPILAVYAVYAYAQAGMKKEISSLHAKMLDKRVRVLYDVQLLSSLVSEKASVLLNNKPLRTQLPLFIQGWSYLNNQQIIKQPVLSLLFKHLIPGLWTIFKAAANQDILKARQRGWL
jgi:hypothetical protein